MFKYFNILVLATLLVFTLDGCKKGKNETAKPVNEVKEVKDIGARAPRKKIKDTLSGLEEEDRAAALKLLREEHREQQNKKEEEENVEMTPGFFPVSDGAKQLIDEANLLLRQGADSDSKIEALENLIGIDHPDILPTIELALDDEDPVVREVALDAIMNINSEEVVPIVVKALDDPEPDLRLVSLDALMDVKSASINDALQKAMKDESEEVREGVMDLLFISENPAALPTIKTAFTDSSPAIREGALMCIEDIRDKGAVDILIYDGMLSDYEDVREASKEALEFITDEEFETYDEAKAWWNKNRDSFEFDF
ncbi:HEAT repeat domain-containing protein [bacterium]|jgi:FOG: HEAT repeat|nr:HEAT repeat domain-containing protein [bacterium]